MRRSGEATTLAGVKQKVYEKWIEHGKLPPPDRDGAHADYSIDDVLKLRLTVVMVDFGIPVPIAHRLTGEAFKLAKAKPTAADPLKAWTGKVLTIGRKGQSWSLGLFDQPAFPAALVINVHDVFAAVLAQMQDQAA